MLSLVCAPRVNAFFVAGSGQPVFLAGLSWLTRRGEKRHPRCKAELLISPVHLDAVCER